VAEIHSSSSFSAQVCLHALVSIVHPAVLQPQAVGSAELNPCGGRWSRCAVEGCNCSSCCATSHCQIAVLLLVGVLSRSADCFLQGLIPAALAWPRLQQQPVAS